MQSVYNLYSGTIFSGSGWSAAQVAMLLRGVCKGESSKTLAAELGVSRTTVHGDRRNLQANGYAILSPDWLPDSQTETDEMFQNAGKKSDPHRVLDDPPRRRANKRPGHGTYENDRPPIVGTAGRGGGQCRLRIVETTDKQTVHNHIKKFTQPRAACYTDEWQGYCEHKINLKHVSPVLIARLGRGQDHKSCT
ncbi:MAG: helix-turn-helix domain-containing protein [Blastocatellia bacterium]